MNSLYVVILGGASSREKNGLLPSIDDIQQAQAKCIDNDLQLKLCILDKGLNYALRLSRGETTIPSPFFESDSVKIMGYPENSLIEDVCPQYINTNITNFDGPVIYVGYNLTSSYDVMNLISNYTIDNRWFVVSNEVIPISEVVQDYLNTKSGGDINYLIPNPVYNIYTGDTLNGLYSGADVVDIYNQIRSGCLIMQEYIAAGYHEQLNLMDVKGWCLNMETPFIKGIIYTYGLLYKYGPDDPLDNKTPHIEARTNSMYRRQLSELMATVLLNFAVNNQVIAIEEMKMWGGTFSPKVYEQIYARLDQKMFDEFIYA